MVVVVVAQSLSPAQLFCDPIDYIARLLCPWDLAGKNTGVVCHFLLHGIFPTRDRNHVSYISSIGRQILYQTHSKGSSQPRDQTHVSCISYIYSLVSQAGSLPLSHLGNPALWVLRIYLSNFSPELYSFTGSCFVIYF